MHVLGLAGVISQGKAEEPPDLRLPGEIARTGLHTTTFSPSACEHTHYRSHCMALLTILHVWLWNEGLRSVLFERLINNLLIKTD